MHDPGNIAEPSAVGVIPRSPPTSKATARAKGRRWLWLMVAMVFGALVGFAGARVGRSLHLPAAGPKWIGLITVGAMPLLWFVTVAIHELGHLVGGWCGRGRFLLYVVGPFMWRRTPGGIVFSWNRQVNLGGGLASCLPLEHAAITARRLALMIAGGPAFSLLLAAAAGAVGLALGRMTSPGLALIATQHTIVALAGLSGMIFLVTVFPSTAGGFKSDGRRLFDLLRDDAGSERERALIALTAASLAGTRPAGYDGELVGQMLQLRDGSIFDRYAHFTAFAHAADLGEFDRAQALLDYVVAGEDVMAPFMRDTARCEYAWLLATQTADAATARAWLDSAGKLAFDPATRLRAEAAVLLAEGRNAEAADRARAGLHALAHHSFSPVPSAFHTDLLNDLLRRAGG